MPEIANTAAHNNWTCMIQTDPGLNRIARALEVQWHRGTRWPVTSQLQTSHLAGRSMRWWPRSCASSPVDYHRSGQHASSPTVTEGETDELTDFYRLSEHKLVICNVWKTRSCRQEGQQVQMCHRSGTGASKILRVHSRFDIFIPFQYDFVSNA